MSSRIELYKAVLAGEDLERRQRGGRWEPWTESLDHKMWIISGNTEALCLETIRIKPKEVVEFRHVYTGLAFYSLEECYAVARRRQVADYLKTTKVDGKIIKQEYLPFIPKE